MPSASCRCLRIDVCKCLRAAGFGQSPMSFWCFSCHLRMMQTHCWSTVTCRAPLFAFSILLMTEQPLQEGSHAGSLTCLNLLLSNMGPPPPPPPPRPRGPGAPILGALLLLLPCRSSWKPSGSGPWIAVRICCGCAMECHSWIVIYLMHGLAVHNSRGSVAVPVQVPSWHCNPTHHLHASTFRIG